MSSKRAAAVAEDASSEASAPSSPVKSAPQAWLPRTVRGLLFDHSYFPLFFACVLLAETILGVVIIRKVAYTEIDWIAYMEEVAGFLGGDYDYANLKGQTGPLVYPAGFVYIYSALYYITSHGSNILLAQYIFLGLYLVFIAVLLLIYHEAKLCPPYVFLLLSASRRIHSIFVLRCFNDCVAMLLLYAAVLLLIRHRWTLSCVLMSLAISVKMNVLLFLPALGVILCQRMGAWRALRLLGLMIAIQLVLATPFLLVAPWNYARLAFDFSRAFFYIWTVNLRVVSEETFLSPQLAKGLLMAHLGVLAIFLHKMLHGGLPRFVSDLLLGGLSPSLTPARARPSAGYMVTLLFVSNFIGVVFARSLHYQFYVWYYHTLPLLLWLAPLPTIVRLLLLGCIEFSWNVFPATPLSSGQTQALACILIASHAVLLLALLASQRLPSAPSTTPVPVKPRHAKVQ